MAQYFPGLFENLPKKLLTTLYCAAFSLDSQGQSFYAPYPKKQILISSATGPMPLKMPGSA